MGLFNWLQGGQSSGPEPARACLVFVDAENSTIEPELILETVEAEFGKPRVRQAFAKWSANPFYKNESRKYRDAGFETITCNTGNNNADIQLSVEAVDMMHDFGNRGKCTLIICADGDRGFAHVFDKARKLGWESVLIENEKRGTLSDILRNSTDRVISLDISPDEPVETEAQTTGKTEDKKQTDFQEIDRQWDEKAGKNILRRLVTLSHDEILTNGFLRVNRGTLQMRIAVSRE